MKKNPISSTSAFSKLVLLFAVPFVVTLSSCSDDDDDNNMTPAPTYANMMVTHASPDAPGVDLLIDNVK